MSLWKELLKDWAIVLLLVGGCLLATLATAGVTADNPPACDVGNATQRYEVSDVSHHGILAYCNTPTGYKRFAAVIVSADQYAAVAEQAVRTYIAFGWKAAWKVVYARQATDEEANFLLAEIAKKQAAGQWPSATVKASTASDKARAVMLLQADGTLAAYKVGNVSQRILQALPCDVSKRAPGTVYFAVAGQKSITGVVLPDKAMAECAVSPPETT